MYICVCLSQMNLKCYRLNVMGRIYMMTVQIIIYWIDTAVTIEKLFRFIRLEEEIFKKKNGLLCIQSFVEGCSLFGNKN